MARDEAGEGGEESSGAAGPVIIKKYANRRLYDTGSSAYITLEHLAAMIRSGRDFQVLDAKTGEDLTHGVLTQIILESEGRGSAMLPVNFLKQIIGLYGGQMQGAVPGYLEAAMDAFGANQVKLREAMTAPFAGSPFAELAKRNLDMFMEAGKAFAPPVKPPTSSGSEVAELKAQLAALQEKVERLAGQP